MKRYVRDHSVSEKKDRNQMLFKYYFVPSQKAEKNNPRQIIWPELSATQMKSIQSFDKSVVSRDCATAFEAIWCRCWCWEWNRIIKYWHSHTLLTIIDRLIGKQMNILLPWQGARPSGTTIVPQFFVWLTFFILFCI